MQILTYTRASLFIPGIVFLMMSCSQKVKSSGTSATDNTIQFDKQGHRGARGLMPENTVPAMLKALDLGVTTLEMDVVVTKDKKIVLSHDQWFAEEITTKPDGKYMGPREERRFNIYWMTYEDVKTFDVGLKPHPRFPQQQKMKVTKPLLTDVVDSVRQYMMTRRRPFPNYNIETKSDSSFDKVFQPEPAEFVELLMSVIKEKGIEDFVTIQSFDFRTLRYLHKTYPAIKTAMLIEEEDTRTLDQQIKSLGFVPTVYSPAYPLVNDKLVKACHKQKMKLIPWTVNRKEEIEKLKAIGVDGIITDYPNLFNE